MADIRSKALAYYRDGNVLISYAYAAGEDRKPREVLAYVEGYRSTHLVRLTDGRWGCSCGEDCAHVAAVQLATGHQSAAAKPTPEAAIA